ncbi:MAG TPA: hypothetical protein VF533_14545, partial [Solirubrobacteraceae bacterium]
AEELVAAHEVHLSIGSRQTPLPQRILGRDLFAVLTTTRLIDKTVDSRIGTRMQARGDTLIGYSPRSIRRLGVRLRPRTTAIEGATVRFADHSTLEPASVVWATGFGRDHSIVQAPVFDASGAVIHRRGVTDSPGLYFLGMPWQYTRGSALLGWVKDDAEYIAGRIEALATSGARAEAFAP